MTARMTLCRTLVASIAALAISLRAPAAEPAGLPPKDADPVGGFLPNNPSPPHALTADRPEPTPEPGERAITCPTGSFSEGEANCGSPSDTINGGCGSPLQGFSPIFCNATICGTTRFDGAARDTDWYQFSLNAQRQVTVRVAADFKCVFGFISGTNGVPNCALATGVSPFGVTLPGQTQEVTACLGPGVWWVFVGPDFAQGNLACGTKYWVKLECATPCPVGACCMANNACVETAGPSPCVTMGGRYQGDDVFCGFGTCAPPSNDSCANAPTVTCNSTVFADTRNATFEPLEPVPVCAQGIATGSVWYRVIGTGGRLGVTTCDSTSLDPYAKDSVVAVYRAGNGCVDPSPVTCNDDSSCGPQLRLSRACFNTFPNAVYLIQVMPFSNLSRGLFKVDIECVCTEVPTTGACCLANSGCSSVTQAACETIQGSYKGDGTTCAAAACPNIPPPSNDDCSVSAPFISVPGSTPGYTLYASPDADQSLPACGPPPNGPGVWYRVVGTGSELTASLCGSNLDFDARILVFCGDCANASLVCVAGNDDGANPSCAVAPEATWCSELNRTYSILVTAGTGDSGNFTLTMSTASTPCANPASCVPVCNITYPPGAVSENEPTCGTGYVDATNGGCGVPNTPKGTIACGQTVSGTSGSYTATINSIGRDTDWFRFTLTQATTVTWTVKADFLAQALILNDDCNDQQVFAFAQGNACQTIAATATLEPGTYNVFVSPQFFGDTLCGSKWYGTLTCAASAANGACCLTRCSCIVTSENDCLFNRFGLYFAGPGTTCAQTNCNPCPADMSGDGVVNTTDLVKFLGSFGRDLRGDFNCSGATNTTDLVFFLGRFGMTCPP